MEKSSPSSFREKHGRRFSDHSRQSADFEPVPFQSIRADPRGVHAQGPVEPDTRKRCNQSRKGTPGDLVSACLQWARLLYSDYCFSIDLSLIQRDAGLLDCIEAELRAK